MTEVETAGQEWRRSWPTVLSGTVGVSLTALYLYSTGVLIEPIQHDLGWSRTQITGGLSATTTVAALIGPLVGAAVDRFGARTLAIPGIVLFCGAVAALSLATTPTTWLLLWALVGLCSAGVKPTIWASAVSSLFSTSRGLALAVMLCGTGIGSSLVPIITNALVEAAGWRQTYVYLALLWGGVSLPVVLLFFRSARDRPATIAAPRMLGGLGLRAALLTRRYMFLTLSVSICTLVAMAFVVSVVPMLTGQGLSRSTAAGIAASIGLMSIVGRLGSGFLMDRFNPRLICAAGIAAPGLSAALLLAAPGSVVGSTLAIVLVGVCLGTELGAASYLTSRYFGVRNFGMLFGIMVSAMALTTGLGPLAASFVYDATGSYDGMLIAAVPLSLLAAAMILGMGAPPARTAWASRAADADRPTGDQAVQTVG